MPHANIGEAFVWRAAASRPDRARLIGAIAIALSCGMLGVLAGRWSVRPPPAEPGNRTAQLIEAVSRETRSKNAAAAGDSGLKDAREPKHTPAAPAPANEPPPTDALASTPAAAPQQPVPSKPRGPAAASSHEPAAADAVKTAASPAPQEPAAIKPPSAATRTSEHDSFQGQASRGRKPDGHADWQPGREADRHAGKDNRPIAPDYRALRDYVLSR
jgi:hypothetical protein